MQDLLLSLLRHSSLADGKQLCCWGELSESQEDFVIASSLLIRNQRQLKQERKTNKIKINMNKANPTKLLLKIGNGQW